MIDIGEVETIDDTVINSCSEAANAKFMESDSGSDSGSGSGSGSSADSDSDSGSDSDSDSVGASGT